MTELELCNEAVKALENSYSPYSGYCVGAALLCKNGRLFTGCNIENSAFSPSVCAERTAFFKAISEGKREFAKIAIAAKKSGENIFNDTVSPCGVCRQVMAEFCNGDFEIIIAKNNSEFSKFTLSELLPCSFGMDNIK